MDEEMLDDIFRESPIYYPDGPKLLHNVTSSRLTSTGDVLPAESAPDFYTRQLDLALPSPDIYSETGAIIAKLEDVFDGMLDCTIDGGKELCIRLKSRSKAGKALDANGIIKNRENIEAHEVCFPGKNIKESWKFSVLLTIIQHSHAALVTGVTTTKRDIFYQDPVLFSKQAVVDKYVDDLAYTLGVDRSALNIDAAAKGLIVGALKIQKRDDTTIDCSHQKEGILIPNVKDFKHVDLSVARWVLVIEKEATFRTLANIKYWETSSAGPGILITAKGYPDILTRSLLFYISTKAPSIPLYCLADFDPDGLAIVSTYKHGSAALAHENGALAVPRLQWLGVKGDDMFERTSMLQKDQETATSYKETGIMKLTERDRKLATRMLGNDVFIMNEEWRSEIQGMLNMNMKAEIQFMGKGAELGDWLDGKLKLGRRQ